MAKHNQRVFENGVLRRTSGSKRKKLTGKRNCRMRN